MYTYILKKPNYIIDLCYKYINYKNSIIQRYRIHLNLCIGSYLQDQNFYNKHQ
jgi:hypothetical protein